MKQPFKQARHKNRGELDSNGIAETSERFRKRNFASPVSPEALAELLERIEKDEITGAIGKRVFAKMFETGKPAAEIIASEGLSPINDAESVEKICSDVLAKNPDNVAKYRAGNEGVFKFFVGQVMRETRGRANPQTINDILKRLLQQS